jgi:hypothetical protein
MVPGIVGLGRGLSTTIGAGVGVGAWLEQATKKAIESMSTRVLDITLMIGETQSFPVKEEPPPRVAP